MSLSTPYIQTAREGGRRSRYKLSLSPTYSHSHSHSHSHSYSYSHSYFFLSRSLVRTYINTDDCSQKTTQASKGPKVTLRKNMGSQNSDVSSMPRETETHLQTWNLTQFHQRVVIGRTRIYNDKQYIQRIKESSRMMLSRHRRIISLTKSASKRSTGRYIQICRFLIPSQQFNNSHNAEDDTRICCTWYSTKSPVCHCI